MNTIVIYLIFTGNCREALEFYASSLGGTISHLKTFKESPLNVSKSQEELIFDSELIAESLVIKASDSLPENKITIGTNFSLFLICDTYEELETVSGKLSKDGSMIMPLNGPNNPSKFCMFKDKFAIQWMMTTKE